MEQHKLLDSLRTSVKRLIKLSPKLNRPEFSVRKGQSVPINQWQGKLEFFIKAIDGTVSDCDEWLAKVKVLAAEVEEILKEIAGTEMNADLRAKIGHVGGQMATLDERRSAIGLVVYGGGGGGGGRHRGGGEPPLPAVDFEWLEPWDAFEKC